MATETCNMNDSDARGLILRRLYDIRDVKEYANIEDFDDLNIEPDTLGRLLEQLAEKSLIKWNPKRSSMSGAAEYLLFMAKIKASGADVIEGKSKSPISITVDNSVKVHGSQGVQIGGQGNVQSITMDVGKLMNAVEAGTGTMQEKEEAKSLLKKVLENPLAKAALDWLLGAPAGKG